MKLQGQIVDIRNKRIFKGEITIENGKITSIVEKYHNVDHFILPGFVDIKPRMGVVFNGADAITARFKFRDQFLKQSSFSTAGFADKAYDGQIRVLIAL